MNGTMLQEFEWDLPADGRHWRRLALWPADSPSAAARLKDHFSRIQTCILPGFRFAQEK